jgi:hypothetical protein
MDERDTYPVWTVRFTWHATDSAGKPLRTYATAGGETDAFGRAGFVLDHYQDSHARALVCAEVKRPDGWAEVPRSTADQRCTGRAGPEGTAA